MDPIVYRPMEPADADAVSRLILDSFGEFIAGGYSDEGRAEFARFVQPAVSGHDLKVPKLRQKRSKSIYFVP